VREVEHTAIFDQLLGGIQPTALFSTLTSKLYMKPGARSLTKENEPEVNSPLKQNSEPETSDTGHASKR